MALPAVLLARRKSGAALLALGTLTVWAVILPAVPIWCALAGVGLGVLPVRRWRPAAAVALVLAAAVSGATFRTLTFGDLGQYPDRPEASAYDDTGPVNRLLLAAHDQPHMCGLRIDASPLAWTGGYSDLHRRVPIFTRDEADLDSGWVDHVIAEDGAHPPGWVIARDGGFVLVELPVGVCVPSPRQRWHLR